MTKENTIAVAVVALVLGTVAVALTFAAYANRIKIGDVTISSDGTCNYPSSPSFALGIVAAIFLLSEQVIVSVGTGCFCCRGTICPTTCTTVSSFVLFIFSWVTFVTAFLGLIGTAILNNSSYLANAYPSQVSTSHTANSCFLSKDVYFIGDAIWCIVTIILGINSYIILKNNSSSNGKNFQRGYSNFAIDQGFAMGQPSTQSQVANGSNNYRSPRDRSRRRERS